MSGCTEFVVTSSVLDGIVARAQQTRHGEIVGMVTGQAGGHGVRDVPLPNVLPGPTTFLADPRMQFLAEMETEARGESVLALYHSHPAGDASFSLADAEFAVAWECVHLVVGLTPAVAVRAYRVSPSGESTEIPLRRGRDPGPPVSG